jgi:hypothetical protein
MCLRWEFPLWHEAKGLDPASLQGKEKPKRVGRQEMSVEEFVEECVMPHDPCSQSKIVYVAGQIGLTERKAKRLIEIGLTEGLLVKERNGSHLHIVVVRPGIAEGKAQVIAARLANDASATVAQLATDLNVSERYIREIRNANEGMPASATLLQ